MKKWTMRLALLAATLNVAVELVRLRTALKEEKAIIERAKEMVETLIPPAQATTDAVGPVLADIGTRIREATTAAFAGPGHHNAHTEKGKS